MVADRGTVKADEGKVRANVFIPIFDDILNRLKEVG